MSYFDLSNWQEYVWAKYLYVFKMGRVKGQWVLNSFSHVGRMEKRNFRYDWDLFNAN